MSFKALTVLFLFFFLLPVFAQEECETSPEAAGLYGFDRVLLDWDASDVSGSTCKPKDAGGEGYFCDAVQFSIMLSKHYQSYNESANQYASALEEEEIEAISGIESLSDIESAAGLKPGFDALLLEDNYSEWFKEDFDSHYGAKFFRGKQFAISGWSFENSPMEPGLYSVSLEAGASFDGFEFTLSDSITVSFTLKESLSALDSRLGTELWKNPFLDIPFDPVFSDGARDFGSSTGKSGIRLNSNLFFHHPEARVASLEIAESAGTYGETIEGLVLSLSRLSGSGHSHSLLFTESIPAVISIELPESEIEGGERRAYYTIGDSLGELHGGEFFGDTQKLFSWQVGDARLPDYFTKQKPAGISCSGWDDELHSAVFAFNPMEFDSLEYRTAAFFPPNSSLSVQCVSSAMKFSMQTYTGSGTTAPYSIEPQPERWLGGTQHFLQPSDWHTAFSVKDAVSEVSKGNICVSADGDKIELSWNSTAFLEKKELANMCKLQPRDIANMTDTEASDHEAGLYWCTNAEYCDSLADGEENRKGYRFLSKTYDPCEGNELYCCYTPKEQQEESCIESAMPLEYDYGEFGQPSAEFIEELLRRWPSSPSPGLEENSEGCAEGEEFKCSLGEAFVYFSTAAWEHEMQDESTFTKEMEIDPLIPLAFFSYESQMGVDPKFNKERKSIGNIEKKEEGEWLEHSTLCTNPGFERFCGYNRWWESVRHWNWYMEKKYAGDRGLTTVGSIIPVYAPEPENDPEEYIASVKQRVCRWRAMWAEYNIMEEEAGEVLESKIPSIISKYFKPPKWFTDSVPKISDFVEKYVMFWKWDKDNDGIPDIRDKCDSERETFNDFEDDDGCPDKEERTEYLRTTGRRESTRARQMSTVPSSISGKKVILFIPSDFDYSESSEFMRRSREYFNDFIDFSGLKGSDRDIVFVADSVQEYKSLESCRNVRTLPTSSFMADRKISNFIQYFKDVESCARDYLRKKYGFVPDYADYRVVSVIDSKKGVFYDSLFGFRAVNGLANFGYRSPKNRVLAVSRTGTVSHELGHTFGFGEQYSSDAYIRFANYSYMSNFYPGPLQQHYNLAAEKRPELYKSYPQGTSAYPTCPSESPRLTNCPEVKGIFSDGDIDCDGRYTEKGRTNVRSPMGSTSDKYGHKFDCYEQAAIRKQWGA